jgi:hypothetical protein
LLREQNYGNHDEHSLAVWSVSDKKVKRLAPSTRVEPAASGAYMQQPPMKTQAVWSEATEAM